MKNHPYIAISILSASVAGLWIILILLPFTEVQAQDSLQEKKWNLSGYVKDMQSAIIGKIDEPWVSSHLIHNRLNFRWYPTSKIQFGAELRNRFHFGDLLLVYPQSITDFETDEGLLNLSKNIASGEYFVLNTSLDRLWIDYTAGNFQVTAGRQRVNWSKTFVWNPNDIFNTYSYFDFDYEEKPGSDAVRLQYYLSPASKFELTAKLNSEEEVTAGLLYEFNLWNYDFQTLAGMMNSSDYVIGFGWAGDVVKGGFRGECSYFRPIDHFSDSSGTLVVSAGYDYAFKNSMFAQAEVLYNDHSQQGADSLLFLTNSTRLSAKSPFLEGFSYFLSLSYPFTPLFSGTASAIMNPENKIIILIPTLAYSLAQNLDVSLIAQYLSPLPDSGFRPISFVFLRFKYNF